MKIKSSTILLLCLLFGSSNEPYAQRLKDKLNKLKQNINGTGSEDKKNERMFTSIELHSDGKLLNSLELGKKYQITVVGVSSEGERKEFSKRTKNDPDQNAHFLGKAQGGVWHNIESTLKVMSGRANLMNDSVIVTLRPKDKTSEKYRIALPVFFPSGYEMSLSDERNGFMPAGYIFPIFYPIINGTANKDNPQYLWNLSEDYDFEIENGKKYRDAFRFDRLPFGLGSDDKMIIKAISKSTGELFFTKEVKVDFSGNFSAGFTGKSGEDGARGSDNYQGIGSNGGAGGNGGPGQNIQVYTDVFSHSNGQKLIKIMVLKEDGSKRYYSFDPKEGSANISSIGGHGGKGGTGGNGKNTNGKPGNGGNAGNGGQIIMTISPAAKALNPKINLTSKGGYGGSPGPGIGGIDGVVGNAGKSGKKGPEPIIKTGPVSFEIPK
jgi:hypothetical protein